MLVSNLSPYKFMAGLQVRNSFKGSRTEPYDQMDKNALKDKCDKLLREAEKYDNVSFSHECVREFALLAPNNWGDILIKSINKLKGQVNNKSYKESVHNKCNYILNKQGKVTRQEVMSQ